MENISLPVNIKYQADSKNKNKGSIIIEPCYPGYGISWGNTLRRVLLSSLPGAAVTAVKIKGVKYEFSTIPNIKEDVLDIILNLKLLRLKILSEKDESIKLTIKARGEKEVKAADIEPSSEVEIINQNLLIATLTNKKANLEMEIWVTKGYSWVPSEEKSRKGLDVGTIVMDSIFSPVLKVGTNIENVRVGKRTDYDKLILNIETDGTILPKEAFLLASRILADQFIFLTEGIEQLKEAKKKKVGAAKKSKKIKKIKKGKKIVKKTSKKIKGKIKNTKKDKKKK